MRRKTFVLICLITKNHPKKLFESHIKFTYKIIIQDDLKVGGKYYQLYLQFLCPS